MTLAGVLVLWPTAEILPDLFKLLGGEGLARDIGLLLLSVWLLLAVFGGACLLLAWRLAHADRVARGLAYVLCGGLGFSIMFGDAQPTELDMVMLACFATVAVLAWAPAVQQFFAGDDARQGEQPVPVVVARTLVAVWACCVTLFGVTFLPIGALGGKYVVIGLVMLALAAAAFLLNRRLAAGDSQARVAVTAGAGVYLLLTLILGRRDPGLILPLAMAAGIAWNLWVPHEAKLYFGQVAGG